MRYWRLFIVALSFTLFFLPINEERHTEASSEGLSTPQLIQNALEIGLIDHETANLYYSYALGNFELLPDEYKSSVPWDGTLVLSQLQQAVAQMEAGPKREAVQALLAGYCGTAGSSLPYSTQSTYFYIEYSSIGGGLNINSYKSVLDTSWQTEVSNFGWAAPPVYSSNPPPNNKYHVRIENLGDGLYGYVASNGTYAGEVGNNVNTPWTETTAYASCMVLNSDFSGFPGTTLAALQATAAHEFNHSIQFGYGVIYPRNIPNIPDDSFIEGGATWIEDEVFDSSNDNYNFLWPVFNKCMGEYNEYPYSYWITFRGLTERFGAGYTGGGEDVMQSFWEALSQDSSTRMLDALNAALIKKGTTLKDAYHSYAIAVKFNKPCSGGYVYPYCLEEGPAYVSAKGSPPVHGSVPSIGTSRSSSIQDYYTLNWVGLPTTGGFYDVTLTNNSSAGQLRGSVVCDTGTSLRIHPFPEVAGAYTSTRVLSFDPTGCSSVVAVITNQTQSLPNPTVCLSRGYTISTSPASGFVHKRYFPLMMKGGSSVPNIDNGDFENGPTDWKEYSSHGYDLILTNESQPYPLPIEPHNGDWAVWLGGAHDETSYIEQQVMVPTSSPYLSYWHWIASEDDCGFDFGGVVINTNDVIDLYDLCSSENTNGWVHHVVDLSAYKGDTVQLQIRAGTNTAGGLSDLFVDDVAWQSSPAPRINERSPSNMPAIPKR